MAFGEPRVRPDPPVVVDVDELDDVEPPGPLALVALEAVVPFGPLLELELAAVDPLGPDELLLAADDART